MNIKNKINFHYDQEVDVLYASIGKPKPATSVEQNDGTLIRVDPHSNKVVGFTVINYMYRIKKGLLKTVPGFENIQLPIYK